MVLGHPNLSITKCKDQKFSLTNAILILFHWLWVHTIWVPKLKACMRFLYIMYDIYDKYIIYIYMCMYVYIYKIHIYIYIYDSEMGGSSSTVV